MITAIVLISACGLYYLVYGGTRRENITNRNFRALADLAAAASPELRAQ